nr:hypothetical transcript [Hymenolepis microstoma]
MRLFILLCFVVIIWACRFKDPFKSNVRRNGGRRSEAPRGATIRPEPEGNNSRRNRNNVRTNGGRRSEASRETLE